MRPQYPGCLALVGRLFPARQLSVLALLSLAGLQPSVFGALQHTVSGGVVGF